MLKQKCEDCPTKDEIKNPNIAFDWLRDLSNKQIVSWGLGAIIVSFGFVFSLGVYIAEQNAETNQVSCLVIAIDSISNKQDNLNYNVKRIADFLDQKGYVPSNLAQLNAKKPKTVVICSSQIPKNKKREQRITNDETAINSKEDLESLILE